MERISRLFALLLLAPAALLAQTTTITASHIQGNVSGVLLASGYFGITPVGTNGRPMAFTACGGGQVLPTASYWPISNGALGSVVVPDTSCSSPSGVGYLVTVTDAQKIPLYSYTQAIYPSGSTWSLDTWSPGSTVIATHANAVSSGGSAPTGSCTEASLYYQGLTAIYVCIGTTYHLFPIVAGDGVGTPGDVNVGSNLGVGGNATISGTTTMQDDAFFGGLLHTQLTPSSAVVTDASGILEAISLWPLAMGGTNATSAPTALSNLLGNPAAGSYSVACSDASHCTYTSAAGSSGSGLNDPGANGLVARVADGTSTARTLQPTTNSTCTWTNADGVSGNPQLSCTFLSRVFFAAAFCNATATGPGWNLPISNAAVPACLNGSNTQQGALQFADGQSGTITDRIPPDWTGALSSTILFTSTASSGTVIFNIATSCTAVGATDDNAFNAPTNYATVTLSAANVLKSAAASSITTTGCAAGNLLHVRISRATDTAIDTGVAVRGVELIIPRTM